MLCAGPVEEQIKPASGALYRLPGRDRHAPATLRLILLLRVNIHKEIVSSREEGDEVTLPCLSPGLRCKFAEAGSGFAAADLRRERRAQGLARDGIFFQKELL